MDFAASTIRGSKKRSDVHEIASLLSHRISTIVMSEKRPPYRLASCSSEVKPSELPCRYPNMKGGEKL
jgi:hypothetical protein